ncbi:MAG TPA: glycosyl hydrolase, partial [Candidatus Hydrogenedentes bacterium]|nr:glycosyl hydrolase [Candidatus Hydrogenedentota bacterium]
VDLTAMLAKDGRLVWDAPEGAWTILRFGRTITGQTTRPAPLPGLGLESDKFDPAALDAHFAAYIETLMDHAGAPKNPGRGLTTLHFDSWEMGAQNWSADFAAAFEKSRGYPPLRFLPALTGRVVDSVEVTERFLWDLRQAAQELVIENHVGRLRGLAAKRGLAFSSEPYDLNPCSNMEMGAVADVPMCEFWSKGFGFSTEFSCIEAASTAHTTGKAVVAAEAFTAAPGEDWRQHPASMKAQGDWALCAGINRFAFHRYQAQPWLDRFPGMSMGPYGVHWERTQTWWGMAGAYHRYLARCQHLLRRGLFVADILYLAPEGAPHVFRPPSSALTGDLPDRRGYNFDGCAPGVFLERAAVEDGRIVFPDGMSYRLLVLPRFDTMTPRLLRKIAEMVENGATVIGAPPRKSPSLVDYPQCDEEVNELAVRLWGEGASEPERAVGKGRVLLDAAAFQPFEEKPLAAARWIWHAEGSPAAAAPAGKRLFRHAFEIEAGAVVQSARAFMTADNSFELFVNGRSAGTGNNFNVTQVMEVGTLLQSGANYLEVAAGNGDDNPNPAGLIGALHIVLADGSARVIATNGDWISAREEDGAWTPVMDLGPQDMAPWNLKGLAPWQRELYPDYDTTARVLSGMGVPTDFSSCHRMRYIHRRDGDADLYFIANPEESPLLVDCRFRVTGRQPEWWDPMTGERRDLPNFTEADGRTSLLMRLDPLQSGFVVFRRPAGTPSPDVGNFTKPVPRITLAGPWQVSFDPKWGGPEKVVFEKLEDWSQRPEPGIKHYSGKAVYRTVFDRPSDTAEGPAFLSLGSVKNMASVRLNGTDLGVAWCMPWRLEIPEGLLRPQGNELEITVANLWINRLIGDSALPKRKRLTWSTLTPFRPDSPLEPSGLLGPVSLMTEKGAQEPN